MENKFIHTLKSIGLCIRYPFLYPRNRWTGKHYNNWKFVDFISGKHPLFKSPNEPYDPKNDGLYQKAFIVAFNSKTLKSSKIVRSWWYAILYYICNFIYDYPMQWLHCIPTYTEWDAMDGMPGWKKAFGDQYLKDLRKQLKKDKMLYSWRITDIKEKYGTLRLYCNFGTDELYKLIDKYENLSYETCVECGKPATIRSDGYILPYCDECFEKSNMRFIGEKKIDDKWTEVGEKF